MGLRKNLWTQWHVFKRTFFSRVNVSDFMSRICTLTVVMDFWHLSEGLEQRFIAENADAYEPLLPELPFFKAMETAIDLEVGSNKRSVVVARGLTDLKERGLRRAVEQLQKCEQITSMKR
jgi:hypothetical protein